LCLTAARPLLLVVLLVLLLLLAPSLWPTRAAKSGPRQAWAAPTRQSPHGPSAVRQAVLVVLTSARACVCVRVCARLLFSFFRKSAQRKEMVEWFGRLAFTRFVFLSHGISAVVCGVLVLLNLRQVGPVLALGNAFFGVRAEYAVGDLFLLVVFASALLAMGGFDLLALFSSSQVIWNARCLIGVLFNGTNALGAAALLLRDSATAGYVFLVVVADGLFALLYLVAFVLLHSKGDSKKRS
jgi:hypothetical protein